MGVPTLLLFNRFQKRRGPTGADAISWTLRDDFTDTRAAGSVNGTPATPGPGTRVVVDTNSIISTAGGVLVVNGTPALNDRYVLDGVARAAGRVLVATLPTVTTVTNTTPRFGWASNATTNTPETAWGYSSTTVLRVFVDVAIPYNFTVGSAPHYLALVLKATGGYYFAKVSGNWILAWHGGANSTATMYPKMLMTASAQNFAVDNFRVPVATWLPTPLAYDTFTRAAIGSTETTGPDGQGAAALAWSLQAGTVAISSDAAICSALAGGLGIATVATGSANVIADVNLTRNTATAGLILRYVDADNYLKVDHDGTNLIFTQRVAGSNTDLVAAAAAYGAARQIRCILNGTVGQVFYNGVQIGANQTVPASTSVNHGLYFTDTDSTLDAFAVFPFGNGGEHAALDRFIG